MRVEPHLTFRGDCEEAFRFYERLFGGGAGLLVVDSNLLIPFARSICVEIDPAAKRIAVELPEGLKDLNRP